MVSRDSLNWIHIGGTAVSPLVNTIFNSLYLIISYDKDETVKFGDQKIFQYTHLLVEQKGKYFYENEHLKQSHDVLESVNCFSSIGIEYHSFFPVKIRTKPCIVLLRRKHEFAPPQVIIALDTVPTLTDKGTDVKPSEKLGHINDLGMDLGTIDSTISPASIEDNANEWDIADANKIVVATNELGQPTKQTRWKIKRFVETHFTAKQSALSRDDDQSELVVSAHKQSTKASIRNIIKSEKIKEIAERISQMDLKSMCDLENDSVKSCLIKIIDEHESN